MVIAQLSVVAAVVSSVAACGDACGANPSDICDPSSGQVCDTTGRCCTPAGEKACGTTSFTCCDWQTPVGGYCPQSLSSNSSAPSTVLPLRISMAMRQSYMKQQPVNSASAPCQGSDCGGAGIVKLPSGELCCDMQFCLKYGGVSLSTTSSDEYFYGCGDSDYCFYMKEKHEYCQLGAVTMGAVTVNSESASTSQLSSVSRTQEKSYMEQRLTSCQAEAAGECTGSSCGGAGEVTLPSGKRCCDMQFCLKYGGVNISATSPHPSLDCGDCSYCYYMTDQPEYCQLGSVGIGMLAV